jgi:sugar lactone lactonase YvrE
MTNTYQYQVVEGWGQKPEDWEWGWMVGIACDSQDRVYAYSRSQHPLVVFDRDGNFLHTFGDDVLTPGQAHGIYIDSQDNVYCTDHRANAIYKFDRHGALQMTISNEDMPADGAGELFDKPTDVGIASNGDIYIADGYGNARMHKYSAGGEWLLSWGERGDGPGQFELPHGVRVDRYDRVWVCDRENDRIEIFDTEGRFLEERTDLLQPNTVHFDPHEDVVYIAELTHQVSIYTLDGELITKWGGAESSTKPGEFLGGAHGIWTDSRGDLYVGEVLLDVNGRFQKFSRQR